MRTLLGALLAFVVILLSSCGGGGGGGGINLNPYSGRYSWVDIPPYDQGSLSVAGQYSPNGKFAITGRKKVPLDNQFHQCFGNMTGGAYPQWEITFPGIGTIYGYAATANYLPEDAIAKSGNRYLILDYWAVSNDGSLVKAGDIIAALRK